MNDNNQVKTEDVEIKNNVSFTEMMLSGPVLNGLTKNRFLKPSPIQLRAIPLGRSGLGRFYISIFYFFFFFFLFEII